MSKLEAVTRVIEALASCLQETAQDKKRDFCITKIDELQKELLRLTGGL